eukprot:6913200-Heterocapsa_arctica.AAC.2
MGSPALGPCLATNPYMHTSKSVVLNSNFFRKATTVRSCQYLQPRDRSMKIDALRSIAGIEILSNAAQSFRNNCQ